METKESVSQLADRAATWLRSCGCFVSGLCTLTIKINSKAGKSLGPTVAVKYNVAHDVNARYYVLAPQPDLRRINRTCFTISSRSCSNANDDTYFIATYCKKEHPEHAPFGAAYVLCKWTSHEPIDAYLPHKHKHKHKHKPYDRLHIVESALPFAPANQLSKASPRPVSAFKDEAGYVITFDDEEFQESPLQTLHHLRTFARHHGMSLFRDGGVWKFKPLKSSQRLLPASVVDVSDKVASIKRQLSKAFETLRRQGYFCEQSWACCQGCGIAALPQGTEKAVFYHRQDAKSLSTTASVYLTWRGDGPEIVAALRSVNLLVEWDGSESTRIHVKSQKDST